jgi:hypothetical protein
MNQDNTQIHEGPVVGNPSECHYQFHLALHVLAENKKPPKGVPSSVDFELITIDNVLCSSCYWHGTRIYELYENNFVINVP